MKIALLSATMLLSISCAYSQSRVSGIVAPRLQSNTKFRTITGSRFDRFISEPDVGTSRPTSQALLNPRSLLARDSKPKVSQICCSMAVLAVTVATPSNDWYDQSNC